MTRWQQGASVLLRPVAKGDPCSQALKNYFRDPSIAPHIDNVGVTLTTNGLTHIKLDLRPSVRLGCNREPEYIVSTTGSNPSLSSISYLVATEYLSSDAHPTYTPTEKLLPVLRTFRRLPAHLIESRQRSFTPSESQGSGSPHTRISTRASRLPAQEATFRLVIHTSGLPLQAPGGSQHMSGSRSLKRQEELGYGGTKIKKAAMLKSKCGQSGRVAECLLRPRTNICGCQLQVSESQQRLCISSRTHTLSFPLDNH